MRSSRFTESDVEDTALDLLAVNQFTVAEDTLEQRPDIVRQAHPRSSSVTTDPMEQHVHDCAPLRAAVCFSCVIVFTHENKTVPSLRRIK